MITKDFEEYFPLPWTVLKTKNGAFVRQNAALITGKKSYKELVELGLIEEFSVNSFPPRVAALKYAVLCANLMPEAVEVIKPLIEICKDSCALCAVESRANATKCKCSIKRTIEQAEALLAKLEGGAEE